MSEATRTHLMDAITAHIADEQDRSPLVTGLVLCAAVSYIDNDADTHSYWFDTAEHQPAHVSRGLEDLLRDWVFEATAFRSDDDD